MTEVLDEHYSGAQFEEIPPPRMADEIGGLVIGHEALSEPVTAAAGHEVSTGPRQKPLEAFYDHLKENKHYNSVSKSVRARMRPNLALDFVRQVVTATGEKRGDTSIRPTFDEVEVKRNIRQIQDNYGPSPYPDDARNRPRSNRILAQLQRTTSFTQFAGRNAPVIPELDVAHILRAEALAAEDPDVQDSLEVLLAAYGMSMNGRIDPIE